ncbi:MAG TPA: hypothetical protein VFX67_07075 [Burkholderiales bacterium]|nr:hypothetical protein [Burkholderiales bacterium]
MKTHALLPVTLAMVVLQGCATITSSEMQSLSLTTQAADGSPIEKASCALRNDKGSWIAESPGLVPVRRSGEDLVVECRKEGYPDGILRAVSRAAIGMFGNIIFGGVIGAVVDHSKGTGYDYPSRLPVKMGASIVVDRLEEPVGPSAGDSPAAGLNSPSTDPGGRANSGETVVR